MVRHVGNAGLRALALGDVDRRDQRRCASLVGEKLGVDGNVDRLAIGLAVLPGASGLVVRRQRRNVRQFGGLGGIVQRAKRYREEGFARMAVVGERGVVHRDDALVVERVDEHRHRVRIEQQPERRFALLQLRDVDAQAD
jgi:hypothetical protein